MEQKKIVRWGLVLLWAFVLVTLFPINKKTALYFLLFSAFVVALYCFVVRVYGFRGIEILRKERKIPRITDAFIRREMKRGDYLIARDRLLKPLRSLLKRRRVRGKPLPNKNNPEKYLRDDRLDDQPPPEELQT